MLRARTSEPRLSCSGAVRADKDPGRLGRRRWGPWGSLPSDGRSDPLRQGVVSVKASGAPGLDAVRLNVGRTR